MDRYIKSVTFWLIMVNVAMFALLRLIVGQIGLLGMQWPHPAPWTPITYMLTQGSFIELLFNMLWLWCFSRLFLIAGTERRLLAAYAAGGLGGAAIFAAACATGLCSGGVLMGSSAAVIGIAVCGAMLSPGYGVDLMLLGRVTLKTIAIVTVALGLLPFIEGNAGGGWAHIGGALGGACAGLAMRRGWLPRFSRKSVLRRDRAMTLDSLLDKVRASGYASLSKAEKQRLIELSNELRK